MSDFICVAYTFIPAISPQSDAFAALPDVRVSGRPGEPRRHPLFDGRAKKMSNARTAKKPLPRTATASIAILVYSIIPYLH